MQCLFLSRIHQSFFVYTRYLPEKNGNYFVWVFLISISVVICIFLHLNWKQKFFTCLNYEIMKDGERTVFSISPPIHGSGIQKALHVSVTSILRITYPLRAWCQSQCPGRCAKCQRMADPVTLSSSLLRKLDVSYLLSQSNNFLLLLDSVARISWATSKIQYSKLLGNITWCFASVWLVFCNICMKTRASEIPLLSISVPSTLHRSPHIQRIAR